MANIYGYFIFLDFTLLAIIIAIYVLSATMLGAAKSITETQLKTEAERHVKQLTDSITSVKEELTKQEKAKNPLETEESLRAQLKQLESEKTKNSHNLQKINQLLKSLSLKHAVFIPCAVIILSMILFSLASYGISVEWSQKWHLLLFVLGIVAIFITGWLMVKPLQSIQNIAISTEQQSRSNLVEALKTALREDRRDLKEESKPLVKVEIKTPRFPLTLALGQEQLIAGEIYLEKGELAQNVSLHFGVPLPFIFTQFGTTPLVNAEALAGKLYFDTATINNATLVPGQKYQFFLKIINSTQPGSFLIYYSVHGAGLTQQFSYLGVTIISPTGQQAPIPAVANPIISVPPKPIIKATPPPVIKAVPPPVQPPIIRVVPPPIIKEINIHDFPTNNPPSKDK